MNPSNVRIELEQMRRELKKDSEPLTHGDIRKLFDAMIELCGYLDMRSGDSGFERDVREMLERPDFTGRLP
jgi:hypothetical protein